MQSLRETAASQLPQNPQAQAAFNAQGPQAYPPQGQQPQGNTMQRMGVQPSLTGPPPGPPPSGSPPPGFSSADMQAARQQYVAQEQAQMQPGAGQQPQNFGPPSQQFQGPPQPTQVVTHVTPPQGYQALAQNPPPPQAQPEAKPKGRGRPRKNAAAAQGQQASPQPQGQAAIADSESDGDDFLFINCAVEGLAIAPLEGYVDSIVKRICAQYGIQDLREPRGKDFPLSFQGWKGVLAAAIKAAPPLPDLYSLWVRGNDIMQVAAEALAEVYRGRGGFVVWGS